MLRLIAMAGLMAGLLTSAAGAYPESDAVRQRCTTQSCRDCVDRCDRALDVRMADCASSYPRPGENQQMCFYWALADHNMCLHYECSL